MVQNRYAGTQKLHWDKTNKRNYHLKLCMAFCWSCASASQHGGFVPREWQAAKGLLQLEPLLRLGPKHLTLRSSKFITSRTFFTHFRAKSYYTQDLLLHLGSFITFTILLTNVRAVVEKVMRFNKLLN